MSLYGNIKKVDSTSFQFDRKYPNRVAMDAAVNADGVYIGRYVLVEYGERFNGPIAGESVEYTGQPNNYIITETGVPVTENQDFLNNKNIDLEAYGAIYDSTVWQKIYLEGTEKYIMVAELNATVPKIDMKLEKPVTYLNISQDEEEEELYVGKRNSNGEYELYKLKGAKEEYTKPSFDTALDTELSYLMHQPTTLSFKVDNDFIDFNKDGFNPAYSFGEKKGTNAVAWVPDPENFNYTKTNQLDGIDKVATLIGAQNGQQIDTKALLMSIPALGNTLNTLYNLLYGTPQGDLTDGVLRPYFELFRPNDEILVPVVTEDGENVTIDGVIKEVSGRPGETVSVLLDEDDIEHLENIFPESVTGKHMNNQGNFVDIDPSDLTSNYLVYADTNELVTVTIPALTGRTDNLAWLENVPGIGEILANNTEGLVGVLRKIFGYSDPITGQTRFYLYSDWATETNLDSNTPAIINKPEVVGGYPVLFEDKTEELENLSEDENAPATLVYNYVDTTIETYYSGGHHDVDFLTWQLTAAPLNQLIVSVEKLPVSQVPHDGNQSDCEFNQSKITVYQEGDLVIISGPFTQLKTFASTNPSQGSHKWLALDLMTNTTDITELKWGEYQLTQDDIDESASVGLAENHIIFWIKADALKDNNMLDTPISVQISKGSSVRTLIFKFKNVGA